MPSNDVLNQATTAIQLEQPRQFPGYFHSSCVDRPGSRVGPTSGTRVDDSEQFRRPTATYDRHVLNQKLQSVNACNAPIRKPFYTIADVADLVDVNERTIRRWIDEGELVAHRFGRQLRISHADLNAFVRARREG